MDEKQEHVGVVELVSQLGQHYVLRLRVSCAIQHRLDLRQALARVLLRLQCNVQLNEVQIFWWGELGGYSFLQTYAREQDSLSSTAVLLNTLEKIVA